MFFLGAVQVIAGAAICAFSAGAAIPLGISLIMEGGKDICKAIYCAYKNIDINWREYGKDKVISLGLSFALSGT